MINLMNRKKIIFVILAVILAIAVPVTIMQLSRTQDIRQRAASTDITVSLDPAVGEATINNEFPVDILIDTKGQGIEAVDITLSFNKDVLNIIKADFSGTQFGDALQLGPNNTTGTYHIFAVVNSFGTVNGSQVKIARLNLNGIALGEGTMSFSKVEVGIVGQETPPPVNIIGGTYTIVETDNTTTSGDLVCGSPSIAPETGPAPLTVTLHGAGSNTGTTITEWGYQWDFDGNGTWDSGVQLDSITHLYEIPGTYTPKYRMKATTGEVSTVCNYPYSVVVQDPTPGNSTPTPTSAVIPTSTPFPTPTIAADETVLNFSVKIPSIGIGQYDNNTPIHPQRMSVIELFDDHNQAIATTEGSVTFSPTSGQYDGFVLLGNAFQTGTYTGKIKLPNTLKKFFPGSIAITNGSKVNATPNVLLATGDLDGDNIMTALDYNIMIACTNKLPICGDETKNLADLNDDGFIDGADLNLLYTAFGVRSGD